MCFFLYGTDMESCGGFLTIYAYQTTSCNMHAELEVMGSAGVTLEQAGLLASLFCGPEALVDPPRPCTISQLQAMYSRCANIPHAWEPLAAVWDTALVSSHFSSLLEKIVVIMATHNLILLLVWSCLSRLVLRCLLCRTACTGQIQRRAGPQLPVRHGQHSQPAA